METAVLHKAKLSQTAKAVVNTLLYYDVFHYPLNVEELVLNSPLAGTTSETVEQALKELKQAGMVHEEQGLWQIEADTARVKRRLEGNARAEQLMTKARKKSRFIGAFPWVRSVSLSGSISKGFVGEDADIDYFIITKPGRLWLARTMLIAYKKIFLLNSYKFFCLNYFIDTQHHLIEERNHFTATELVTLIPTYGKSHFSEFRNANEWAKDYYPNFAVKRMEDVPENKVRGFKKVMEWLFGNKLGDAIDSRCMKITLRFWRKKFSHFDAEEFKVAMKSRSYVSKHHPNHFQSRVLNAYKERIVNFEQQHKLSLSDS